MAVRFWDLFPNGVISYFMGKLRFITFGKLYTYHVHPEARYAKQKSVKGKKKIKLDVIKHRKKSERDN